MTRKPHVDNSRAGKKSLDFGHNRKPGGRADMRSLNWRRWRRETARWLRAMWSRKDEP